MPLTLGTLFRPKFSLPVFLAAKAIESLVLGLMGHSNQIWALGILTILVYGTIAWFAHKHQPISVWAMSLIMLYEGIGQISTSVRLLQTAPFLNLPILCVAIYVVIGGMVLFGTRHQRGPDNG